MLSDILKEKKCFKLVCGAGNEDEKEVEKLVYLYSKAGCNLFDLSANPEIIDAAKRGLKRAGIKNDRYLCVSVGIKGDPHISKALIDEKKCIKCGMCAENCPQKAIFEHESSYTVNSIRCIGCKKCLSCPVKAVEMYYESKNLKEILPNIIKKGIDCIEFHALVDNNVEVFEKWKDINNCYTGILSICTDRSKLGDEALLKRTVKMLDGRKPYSVIIQADGAPMSGGEDDFKTTLQAIAAAEIFEKANLPVYILISGGTNSKSTQLAKLCGVEISGVAIGSYARKIVAEYVDRTDFLENNEVFEKALCIAKNLVETSLKYL